MFRKSFLALLCAAACSSAAGNETLLQAAKIHTSDPERPLAEALVWDDDGRILAVGDAAELGARFPDARRLDVGDATVVPGLIDAHGHIVGLGLALTRVDLVGTRSKQEILERLRAFERDLPAGEWLVGRGWDQNDWPEQEFPTVADLDTAFPERPVWLGRVDGHAGWVNSAVGTPRSMSPPVSAAAAQR